MILKPVGHVLLVVVSCVVLFGVRLLPNAEHPPHAARLVGATEEVPKLNGIFSFDALQVTKLGDVAAFVEGVERAAWIAGVLEHERQVEAERLETARRTADVSVARPGATAHSDAWWRAVAVCEQGGRNDPFFGYFSIMDGSAGGLSWGDQVVAANRIIARAGDRAWAASCVGAGYAASPGG